MQLLFFYYEKNTKRKKFFSRVFSLPISPYFYSILPASIQTNISLWLVAVFLHFPSGQSIPGIAVPLCPFWPSLVVCLLLHIVNVRVMPGRPAGPACTWSVLGVPGVRQSNLLTYAFMCSTMVVLRKPGKPGKLASP